MRITKSQLVNEPGKWGRHIVILGAGASVAAFPNGDANGKRLPTMDNLIEMLGLEPVLERGGVKNRRRNFEDIYSELYENDPGSPFLKEIEEIIYTYFESLKLPELPTVYDHLLMSLRPKDIVATFNWDPFLFDAWNRNKDKVPAPEIIHLHGNVRLAYCPEHPVYGEHGMYCPKCDRELIPSRLLYPVAMKNYANEPFIKTEWEVLKKYLRQAKTLTIFGYGAPTTDKEAVNIMNSAWDKDNRLIERTEIIDKKGDSLFVWAGISLDSRGRQLKGWTNKLIWGDNKLILSSLKNGPLREEIEKQGGLKLIYIDPPFDVGADFSMDIEIGGSAGSPTETFTKKPNILEEIAYRDTWGKGADSFIAMIYERLVLMRDLLAEDGTIYVHCDFRLNSYIRLLMDEVFGNGNYINEITWKRTSAHSDPAHYGINVDSIFTTQKQKNGFGISNTPRIQKSTLRDLGIQIQMGDVGLMII
jgi:Adenine specific DNA methylase Mod